MRLRFGILRQDSSVAARIFMDKKTQQTTETIRLVNVLIAENRDMRVRVTAVSVPTQELLVKHSGSKFHKGLLNDAVDEFDMSSSGLAESPRIARKFPWLGRSQDRTLHSRSHALALSSETLENVKQVLRSEAQTFDCVKRGKECSCTFGCSVTLTAAR